MKKPAICFHRLSKRYGAGPRVLENFNLQVHEKEFVSLIGPSGCGKSTVLKLAAGLMPTTQGSVEIEGRPAVAARDALFFVFQEPSLLPWLSVRSNVELPLKLRGVERAVRRKRAAAMLDLVRLSESAGRFPRELSAGMRMRVSIARALSVSPRLLLLDEPFGALDEMSRNKLNEDLLAIRETDPFTALFVTHSIAEAVFLSSRILVFGANPGRIVESIEVPFDYPRSAELRESEAYLSLLARTTHSLREAQRSA